MDHLDKIKNYYINSQWLYTWFCYNNRSLGMHYGFWDQHTNNRHQAIFNENQAIIDTAKIVKGDKTLDAGCGVGGTALYIASKTGAHVTGITIVPQQIKLANQYAKKRNLTHLTNFQLQDYTKTNFPDNHFDTVYGIESVCYASPSSSFLNEACRILKPGGRLVIADGYLTRPLRTKQERKLIKDLNQGFALKELIIYSAMTNQIKKANFTSVKTVDKTKAVKPSIQYFSKLCQLLLPLSRLLSIFPIPFLQTPLQNSISNINYWEAINAGLASYYLHSAQKPQ